MQPCNLQLPGPQGHRFGRCKSVFLALDGFRPHAPVGIATIAFNDLRGWQLAMGFPLVFPLFLESLKVTGPESLSG